MDELEQLKGNFLRSLKAAEEQSGLDLSWLKVQYMQLYEAAQPSVQADNNRIGDFWNCPKCGDLHGVENNSCGCGYRR